MSSKRPSEIGLLETKNTKRTLKYLKAVMNDTIMHCFVVIRVLPKY